MYVLSTRKNNNMVYYLVYRSYSNSTTQSISNVKKWELLIQRMAIVITDIPMFRAIIFEPASSSLFITTNTFNFQFQDINSYSPWLSVARLDWPTWQQAKEVFKMHENGDIKGMYLFQDCCEKIRRSKLKSHHLMIWWHVTGQKIKFRLNVLTCVDSQFPFFPSPYYSWIRPGLQRKLRHKLVG